MKDWGVVSVMNPRTRNCADNLSPATTSSCSRVTFGNFSVTLTRYWLMLVHAGNWGAFQLTATLVPPPAARLMTLKLVTWIEELQDCAAVVIAAASAVGVAGWLRPNPEAARAGRPRRVTRRRAFRIMMFLFLVLIWLKYEVLARDLLVLN